MNLIFIQHNVSCSGSLECRLFLYITQTKYYYSTAGLGKEMDRRNNMIPHYLIYLAHRSTRSMNDRKIFGLLFLTRNNVPIRIICLNSII